jgi:hypothetical protein
MGAVEADGTGESSPSKSRLFAEVDGVELRLANEALENRALFSSADGLSERPVVTSVEVSLRETEHSRYRITTRKHL